MIDWLRHQAGNLASRYALVLGAVFTALFGMLLTNSRNPFVRFDQKTNSAIIETAIIALGGCALAINRLRISRGEVYSFGARFAGTLACLLAVFCVLFTDNT